MNRKVFPLRSRKRQEHDLMLNALSQFGLGFMIGFTGAAIPGPLTTLVVANGLSGGNRFHGFLAALGHCVVEAGIIALVILGLVTVFEAAPLRILNMAGGASLVIFGLMALAHRNANTPGTVRMGASRNAFLKGVTLSVFNGTIPLWWGTVGVQQLSYVMTSTAMLGALLWVTGHWFADLAWYGILGYSSYRGRRRLSVSMTRHITLLCSLVLLLLGGFFIILSLRP